MNISFGNGITRFLGKPKRNGFGVGSLVMMIFLGLVFTGASLPFVGKELVASQWPTVRGTITHVTTSRNSDNQTMYQPTVTYSVNGTSYQTTPNFTSSAARSVGDTMTIAYNEADPGDSVIRSQGFDLFIYLFPLIGLTCLVLAPILYIKSRRRGSTISNLTSRGQKVSGIVTNILDERTANSGGIKVVVSATDPTTGQVNEYISDEVTGNTFGLLQYRTNPIPMDVYISQANPEEYYVDISDIPSLTPEKIMSLIQGSAASPSTQNFTESLTPTQARPTLSPSPVVPPQTLTTTPRQQAASQDQFPR